MVQLPPEELEARLRDFQKSLQQENLDAALILQRIDLYYYSGTTYLHSLFIPADGAPLGLTRQELPYRPPWPTLRLTTSADLGNVIASRLREGALIGLEFDVLPVNQYQRLAAQLPAYRFADASPLIRRQRARKSAWELEVLRETARRDLAVWEALPTLVAGARTDLDLAAGLEALARRQGHQGLVKFRAFNEEIFFNVILAGPAGAAGGPYDTPLSGRGVSPTFPQGASGVPLRPGEPILVDYGGCYQGYVLDQTRLFALGRLPFELRRVYDTARRIQDAVVQAARPGVTCGALYQLAAGLAEESGLLAYFMGPKRVPYIGHGVGLELDDWPVLAQGSGVKLEPGMVFALEPKFAIPGQGAVGLENCFAVTATGLERLSPVADDPIIV